MTHHQRSQRQQTQQRCTVCMLFQSMGRGQYRSSYDREMYLHHLETAHRERFSDDQGNRGDQGNQPRAKGDVLKK
jgi:hypothetical protein